MPVGVIGTKLANFLAFSLAAASSSPSSRGRDFPEPKSAGLCGRAFAALRLSLLRIWNAVRIQIWIGIRICVRVGIRIAAVRIGIRIVRYRQPERWRQWFAPLSTMSLPVVAVQDRLPERRLAVPVLVGCCNCRSWQWAGAPLAGDAWRHCARRARICRHRMSAEVTLMPAPAEATSSARRWQLVPSKP